MLLTNVCERFIHSCYGELGEWLFLGFLVSSLCFVHAGGIGFGFLPPGVYKTWVLLVCLLFLVTPLGR